ncbi:MAG TPA: FkbM family methyltransferase [Pseudomonadales bacterium]|nr:FkbM family methyltransferase [Pseudomonadales bacterium]
MGIQANKKNLQQKAAEWVCRNRQTRFCHFIGQAAYLLWRVYENRNFDISTNGEEWLLRKLSSLKNIRCIFDVGTNVGEWLLTSNKYFPDVPIHAFEISPTVFPELQKNTAHLKHPVLNGIGLSDQSDELTIHYAEDSNYLTTTYPEHLGEAFRMPGSQPAGVVKSQRVPVMRGDDYAKKTGITFIDVLKIDVEGMEERVLRGFEPMFAQRRIRLVQFEYNTTNIVSKFLLRDAYEFFNKLNYCVGKLYPNYVDFRDYHYRQEDFCGPNMVAVHKDDAELLKLLSSKKA